MSTTGASPVAVNSVGYVLEQTLAPDINQIIPFEITRDDELDEIEATGTPGPPPFMQGESIILSAGPILDYNGNPVRDGTLVQFYLNTTNVEGVSSQRELTALTIDGKTTASC